MVQIYEKPVRLLMKDMVAGFMLKKGDVLSRDRVFEWFAEKYPKIKDGTIHAHLVKMSTNLPSRVHYSASPEGDDDVFFRIDPSHFRLYDPSSDPGPIYEGQHEERYLDDQPSSVEKETSEFAYERDLRNYLSKNLSTIESGLKLYEDEGINGIEFPAGGRFIDILGVDSNGDYAVIELKVSKGYDRTVGQILRYMAWIEKHQADAGQEVRGIIVAKSISEDLTLACSKTSGIDLYEYELSVSLKRVE